jgi:hypothetical protein
MAQEWIGIALFRSGGGGVEVSVIGVVEATQEWISIELFRSGGGGAKVSVIGVVEASHSGGVEENEE